MLACMYFSIDSKIVEVKWENSLLISHCLYSKNDTKGTHILIDILMKVDSETEANLRVSTRRVYRWCSIMKVISRCSTTHPHPLLHSASLGVIPFVVRNTEKGIESEGMELKRRVAAQRITFNPS